MERRQRQQIKKIFDLLLLHWKLIIACLLAGMTVGLGYYLYTPKIYKCTALLSYERQQINPARMAPEQGNQRLLDTLSTLRTIVVSRQNLSELIDQYDLYKGGSINWQIEDFVRIMRKSIDIEPASRGDTFSVSFSGRDQDKVLTVTNALAAKFIDENLKYREERATETSKYTQEELDLAKEVLDKKDQVMRDYKLKHYNELPEQRESNLTRLNSLHEQYQAIQDSIQDLERTKVMVREQINIRNNLAGSIQSVAPSSRTTAEGQGAITPWQRLQQLRSYLVTLELKYTEKHPEVKRTKQQITRLESELAGQKEPNRNTSAQPGLRQDPETQQLQLQLKEISLNISNLRTDQEKIRGEISKYEQWVAATPVREAEWNALTRDYDELRRHYDYLVSQNLQASSAEHLERKQKGSKFKIVELARFPEKPFKPVFKKILFAGVAAGLAVGVGLAFAQDFLDSSFKSPEEIEEFLGLTVVSSIPYLEIEGETIRNRWKMVSIGMLYILYTALLLGAGLYFWRQGQIVL